MHVVCSLLRQGSETSAMRGFLYLAHYEVRWRISVPGWKEKEKRRKKATLQCVGRSVGDGIDPFAW